VVLTPGNVDRSRENSGSGGDDFVLADATSHPQTFHDVIEYEEIVVDIFEAGDELHEEEEDSFE
jgi:hypothetical protein